MANTHQLLILTLRPIYFVAIKKSFAERYVSTRWSIEHHSQLQNIRTCSNAARRNLRLARWLVDLSPSRKLLQAALHHVFSAEIMLMLQEMVCSNLEPIDLVNIDYGVELFESEANAGSAYARECLKILRDMKALVNKFKVPMDQAEAAAAAAAATAAAVAEIPMPLPTQSMAVSAPSALPTPPDTSMMKVADLLPTLPRVSVPTVAANGTHMIPFQISEGDALYQELSTWMEYDDMQLYNSYLI